MKSIIERIISGDKVDELLSETLDHIFTYGPIDPSDLELLTYVKIYQPALFTEYEKSVLMTMGLFFKNITVQSFRDIVFDIYIEKILNLNILVIIHRSKLK